MRSELKRFFSSLIFFINLFFFSILQGGSLGGSTSYFAYQTKNNVFYDQQSAVGAVRMENGFTVTSSPGAYPTYPRGMSHGSSVYMDTCISVSGAIDLRGTSTVILLSDLILDNGVTFSSSGKFYGYDRSILLNGDISIPAGNILHIGGRIAINGRGCKLTLGSGAQLFVDTAATLTLRNLFVRNTNNGPGNPPVQCAATNSQLCLENVILEPANDFYFNQGQLWIYGDVAYTGTSTFYYRSTSPSYITSGATLNFDLGTVFDFYPSTTGTPGLLAKDLLSMQDSSSKLYLNGCTLKTTYTGLRLTKGQIIFDNKVTLTTAFAQVINPNSINGGFSNIFTGSAFWGADRINCIDWRPDECYIVAIMANLGGLPPRMKVFSFSPTSTSGGLLPIGGSWGSAVTDWTYSGAYEGLDVRWSPDGQYVCGIAMAGSSPAEVKVYKFTGQTANGGLTQVGTGVQLMSGSYGTGCAWTPDGNYVAAGNLGAQIMVYKFVGASPTGGLIPVGTGYLSPSGWQYTYGMSWSPNGKYLVVAGRTSSPTWIGYVAVFQLTPGNSTGGLSLVGSGYQQLGAFVSDVKWSPDGQFVAVAAVDSSGNELFKCYRFSGGGTAGGLQAVGSGYYVTYIGGTSGSCAWSPDGKYLVAADDHSARILQFTGQGTQGGLQAVGTGKVYIGYNSWFGFQVAWSPSGRYIAVASANDNSLKVYGVDWRYIPQSQALSSALVFGNSALGSSYDVSVRGLAGSQIYVDGLINYDCVS